MCFQFRLVPCRDTRLDFCQGSPVIRSMYLYLIKTIMYDKRPFLKRCLSEHCLFQKKKTAFTQASLFKKGRSLYVMALVSPLKRLYNYRTCILRCRFCDFGNQGQPKDSPSSPIPSSLPYMSYFENTYIFFPLNSQCLIDKRGG